MNFYYLGEVEPNSILEFICKATLRRRTKPIGGLVGPGAERSQMQGSQVSVPNEAKSRSRRRTKRTQFGGSACETPAIGAGEDGGGVVEQEGGEHFAGKALAEEGRAGREEVVAIAEPGVGNPGAGVDHGDIAG
jgi:hypothetical protein